jgi:acyl-CoA synthetase (AMP-forming)/AMP-acid ligase II
VNFWDLAHDARRVAVIAETGEALSYGELAQRADLAAALLRALGPRRLGWLEAGNTLAWLVAYLGCLRAGHVPLLLPPELPAALREPLVARYLPDWQAGALRPGEPLPGSGLRLEVGAVERAANLHPDLALLLSTSGSTASPRLVRLGHAALQSNAQAIVQSLALGPTDRAITTLPPHYSYGLSVIHSHLQAGACLVLTQHGVLQRPFWQLMADAGVTSLAGVPSLHQQMDRIGLAQRELPALRTLTQAGGRLEEGLMRRCMELAAARGWRFFVMYGQTEATARISVLPPERLADKFGSVGQALPGGQLEIDSLSGEIVYRGANVMLGYANTREDLALGDTMQGVLRTGDLGRMDAEGFLYVSGRLRRFVKLAGHRVGLDEAEAWLQGALGLPVAVTGEDDALLVGVETAQESVVAPARALLAAHLRVHASLLRVVATPALPLLANGKKDYAAVRALAAPDSVTS